MSDEKKQQLEQIVATDSNHKFEDADRQVQYEKLLAGLNLIVEKNTFDQIWENVSLLAEFREKLEAIMALIRAEKIETVWDREKCVEWAEEAGIENPESYVADNFEIFDDHIEIKGDLWLHNSQVRELPAGLTTVGGDLDLYNSQIKVLPAGLTSIGGRLYLKDSQVRELPAGLTTIGGDLNLYNSQIKALPAGLTSIGGYLILENSQIKDIPDNLVIQLDVWAKGCPQSLIDKLNKMKEKGQIKGDVDIT
ncbi:hypothetical protein COT97_00850 [Candidatus Falkowbacteria bacterium CG10_big_fil_rev_8_21_14_0_10_39_11]|uniref:Leucine-rich repeat domain-containing protein n=1 Tax=Candidatus Falkowbacteria bacterium CG10_big_fil_rev_8_21_14_0_10_39_11 TaxID=1974565 RepID=A0A2H0V808_9BACT|nr:MAG: hypothetical protein COT97_00850 [Candidatus Falkowbacteria bacterium CG10_big_fil_rev_8_21_14_0_10_39_11]